MCFFFFEFAYMVDFLDRFLYVEPSLHLWDDADLIWWMMVLMYSWIRFVSILFSIFASMFMSEIGLEFSFLVMSLCGFGIKVIETSL